MRSIKFKVANLLISPYEIDTKGWKKLLFGLLLTIEKLEAASNTFMRAYALQKDVRKIRHREAKKGHTYYMSGNLVIFSYNPFLREGA